MATTALLHRALVRDPDVRSGAVSTLWLEQWLVGPGKEALASQAN